VRFDDAVREAGLWWIKILPITGRSSVETSICVIGDALWQRMLLAS